MAKWHHGDEVWIDNEACADTTVWKLNGSEPDTRCDTVVTSQTPSAGRMDQQYETELASHRDWAFQEFSIRDAGFTRLPFG
jgi:hypothetical protein